MSLGWIIFTLSVLGYLTGGIVTFKKVTWWWIKNGHAIGGGSGIERMDSTDWLAPVFASIICPVVLLVMAIAHGAKLTGVHAWIATEPMSRAERKAAHLEQKAKERQERLDKLKSDIKTAEAELDKVTSLVQEIGADPGNFGTSSYKERKYGIPGHRGW